MKNTNGANAVGARLLEEFGKLLSDARVTVVEPAKPAIAEVVLHSAQDRLGSAIGMVGEHSVCVYEKCVRLMRWCDKKELAKLSRELPLGSLVQSVLPLVDCDWQLNKPVPEREIHRFLAGCLPNVSVEHSEDELTAGSLVGASSGKSVLVLYGAGCLTLSASGEEDPKVLLTLEDFGSLCELLTALREQVAAIFERLTHCERVDELGHAPAGTSLSE